MEVPGGQTMQCSVGKCYNLTHILESLAEIILAFKCYNLTCKKYAHILESLAEIILAFKILAILSTS